MHTAHGTHHAARKNRCAVARMFWTGALVACSTALAVAEESPLLPISPSSGSVVTPAANESVAGSIFGVPVSAGNYYFAKRVAYMFPRTGQERLEPADQERFIWESLILHYESFRQGLAPTEAQLEERINSVLRDQQQSFTRRDREAYAQWVQQTLGEDVELFEHQMQFMLAIDLLKDRMRSSFPVSITEEDLREEFLNEQHHLGGEMAVFDAREEAQAFYEQVREPGGWEANKAQGSVPIRPVGLMTIEAYIDLWRVSKEQVYALHAMDLGAIGAPMPFGSQWCVYRLLDKRTGDLKDFPAKRPRYVEQLTQRKQYEALKRWVEDLKTSAHLKVVPLSR